MIDGIDLLITVLCFVFLFILIEGWDRDRRRHRRKNTQHNEVE